MLNWKQATTIGLGMMLAALAPLTNAHGQAAPAAAPNAAKAIPAPIAKGSKPLTFDAVYGPTPIAGRTARGVRFTPDGTAVSYLKTAADDPLRNDVWIVDIAGGEPRQLVDSKALAPEEGPLNEAEKARRERQRIASARGVVSYDFSADGKQVIVPLAGDVWLVPRAGGAPRQIVQTPAFETDVKLSPRSKYLSFVRDQNLIVQDMETGRETPISKDGGGPISFGMAEFIAQEEMDRLTGYWWNRQDSMIAYARVDETGVANIDRFDIGAAGGKVQTQRYPRAGAANALVELLVRDLSTGQDAKIDLGPNTDIYLARVNWSRDGSTLYVQRQSRDQRRLDMLACDPRVGSCKVLVSQTQKTWVNLNDDFHALKDGGFIWSSEDSGTRRLERRGPNGELITLFGGPDLVVESLLGVDEQNNLLTLLGWRGDPTQRHVYMIPLSRPLVVNQLTQAPRRWTATGGGTQGAFIGTSSGFDLPPQTGLYDGHGKLIRWIEENALTPQHPFWAHAGRVTMREGRLQAADGQWMHYLMRLPPGFDPKKKYPAIVQVYGGPNVQRVTRAFPAMLALLMAERGYVVFELDNRGSYHRGKAFEDPLAGRLGSVEVEDQLKGLDFLKAQPFIDPKRVGVNGWSYGGYMVLRLLTKAPGAFRAGASGAPVADWSLYDTHYTERYMAGGPQDQPQNYTASSVLPDLPQLKDRLMLIHGMADDNVIFENATRVMDGLQARSIPFEAMVYPGQAHGIREPARARHVAQTILEFFDRNLKPAPAAR